MNRFPLNRCFALLLSGLSLFAGSGRLGAQQAPPAKPAQRPAPKQTQIGDIRITNYDTIKSRLDFSSVTVTGAKTLVEVPDKASRSNLRLHADTITTRKDGKISGGILELTGNVRYAITQTQGGSDKTVEGTAGHALYRRATQKVELDQGVNATLTEPERLNGPAALKSGSATVDMSATPYRYILSGNSDANDLRFSPRQNPANANKGMQTSGVHVTNFAEGEFQAGQIARFKGAGSTLDLENAAEKSRARVRASSLEATFTPEHSDLSHAEAAGNVQYDIERPAVNGPEMQKLVGTGTRLSYDVPTTTITLLGDAQQGALKADFTDPDSLLKPAHLSADKVIVQRDATNQAYRYQLSGDPANTRLLFTPRQNQANAKPNVNPKPATEGFSIGEVDITRFASGTYEPGKTLEFTGEKVLLNTSDPQAKTRMVLQSARVAALFTPERALGQIESTGNVQFHAEQPSSGKKPDKNGKNTESVSGTAKSVTFVNGKTRQIIIRGPIRADVQDPESLAGPGHIKGNEGDTLTLDVSSSPYEFNVDSPNQTATIDFTPKDETAIPTTAGTSPIPKK